MNIRLKKMKLIATIDPEKAPSLARLLGEKQIAFQTHTATDKAGFELTGFMVNEEVYETACTVVEEWVAARIKKTKRFATNCCPSCHSPNVKYESNIDCEKTVTKMSAIYRCKDCGRVWAK